jgi:hypothetical protein
MRLVRRRSVRSSNSGGEDLGREPQVELAFPGGDLSQASLEYQLAGIHTA